jgi:hypothetical protein
MREHAWGKNSYDSSVFQRYYKSPNGHIIDNHPVLPAASSVRPPIIPEPRIRVSLTD